MADQRDTTPASLQGNGMLWTVSAVLAAASFLLFSVFATPLLLNIWNVSQQSLIGVPAQLISVLNVNLYSMAILLALPFLILRRETGLWFLGLAVFAGLFAAGATVGNLLRLGLVFQTPLMIVGFVLLYGAFGLACLAFRSEQTRNPAHNSMNASLGLWVASIGLLGAALMVQVADVPAVIRLVGDQGEAMAVSGQLRFRHVSQPQFYPIILGLLALCLRRWSAIWLMVLSLLMLSRDLIKQWAMQLDAHPGVAPVFVTMTFVLIAASLVCFWRSGASRA